jgi:hypothetical protein
MVRKSPLALLLALALTGCGTPMASIMASCDQLPFPAYAECVKARYTSEGRAPGAPSVRALYAHLDALSEAVTAGQMTQAQAKSFAHRAYMETVEAQNNVERMIQSNQPSYQPRRSR